MCAHQDTKLLDNTLQRAQPVVLGESGEKVLDNALLVCRSNVLLKFLDDLLLVVGSQRWGAQDLSELGVLLENSGEGFERLCGGVENVGFGGRGVLQSNC